jgi:hypothetical protein
VQAAVFDSIPALDEVLGAHRDALGADFAGYRNHTYRVVNLCVALTPEAAGQLEKVATAAAFHDLGIWTDRTFDYLQPSVRLATSHLEKTGRQEWVRDVSTMILEHHKVSRLQDRRDSLAETFRRADWIDVSGGLLLFGLSREYIGHLSSKWPSAGFHWRLVQLSFRRLLTHPWNPLPMLRL